MAANQALMIEWGMPIEGRELKALEEFMTSMQYWAELKSTGKISDFRTYGTTTGNLQERAGLVILEGTTKQIDALRADEAFRVRFNHVINIGHNINMTLCEMGDDMTTRMQRYGTTVKSVLG